MGGGISIEGETLGGSEGSPGRVAGAAEDELVGGTTGVAGEDSGGRNHWHPASTAASSSVASTFLMTCMLAEVCMNEARRSDRRASSYT